MDVLQKIVFAALLSSGALADITRCGPFFGMQGCPYNADGVSGVVEYCSKWGFCGTSDTYKQQQIAGHYIFSRTTDGSIDPRDVCINQPNPNAFCDKMFPGATCSKSDTRCELFNIPPVDLNPTGHYELVVVRCGPFFQNMACPVNADGQGTVEYCSKFGFCGTSSSYIQAQNTGTYIMSRTLDGSVDPGDVCVNAPSPDAFCQQFHVNSTCNKDEMRCMLTHVNATSFRKYIEGTWTLPPMRTIQVSLGGGSSSGSGASPAQAPATKADEDTSSAAALPLILSAVLIAIALLIIH